MTTLEVLEMGGEIARHVATNYSEANSSEVGEAMLIAMQGLLGVHGTANLIGYAAPKNTG